MPKATTELLKTHQLIRKLLEKFSRRDPRFLEVTKTLHRAVLAHGWFGEKILFPSLKKSTLIEDRFMDELRKEHQDLDRLLKTLRGTPPEKKDESSALVLQIRAILAGHFRKEEDALYPLAEEVLDGSMLNELGDEMRRRSVEVRDLSGR